MKTTIQIIADTLLAIFGENFQVNEIGTISCVTKRSLPRDKKKYVEIDVNYYDSYMRLTINSQQFTDDEGLEQLPPIEELFGLQTIQLKQDGASIGIYYKVGNQHAIKIGNAKQDVTLWVPYLF